MSQFYVTLPSNSSMDVYPQNKTSHYTTALTRRIELHEDAEVALVEASFPFTFLHFPNFSETISIESEYGRSLVIPLKEQYFATPLELVDYINTKLPEGSIFSVDQHGYCKWEIFPDVVTKNVKYNDDDHVRDFVLSPLLAAVLGFTQQRFPVGRNTYGHPQYEYGTFIINLFIGLPEQMYYYCDLVEHQSVGDSLAPLLRVVNSGVAKVKYGTMATVTFNRPYYIPVKKRQFDTVEILIKDGMGRNVSFSHGTSSCVLHFRRRNFV